jgi:hypothetical protein
VKRRSALLVADSGLTKVQRSAHEEGTRQVQRIASYPKVTVTTGGRGVCSHVGSRLLADVAAAAGVAALLDGIGPCCPRRGDVEMLAPNLDRWLVSVQTPSKVLHDRVR